MKLILGSSSPYRRQQLEALGFQFTVVAPNIDETPLAHEDPADLTRRLALSKAQVVAAKMPNHVIIGSDQVAFFENEVLTKPGSRLNALNCLIRFSGNMVEFLTAVAVCGPGNVSYRDEILTTVKFRQFDRAEAEAYLDLDEPYDCAGAIKSECHATLLFESVSSEDPSALIGLPMIRVCEFLRKFGINPLR